MLFLSLHFSIQCDRSRTVASPLPSGFIHNSTIFKLALIG
jgi:hypothetical protein